MSFMDTAWGVAFGGGHALGADLRRGVPRLVQDVGVFSLATTDVARLLLPAGLHGVSRL